MSHMWDRIVRRRRLRQSSNRNIENGIQPSLQLLFVEELFSKVYLTLNLAALKFARGWCSKGMGLARHKSTLVRLGLCRHLFGKILVWLCLCCDFRCLHEFYLRNLRRDAINIWSYLYLHNRQGNFLQLPLKEHLQNLIMHAVHLDQFEIQY